MKPRIDSLVTTFFLMTSMLATDCLSSLASRVHADSTIAWRAVEIDQIEIGYGVQIADINGDARPDIVLADKATIQWYENPSWQKHVIARNLTERDNVCVTARDIDQDGKAEVAAGGQWNYRESRKDGAVFYLQRGDDESLWTPIRLHNEPSTHRMHWGRGRDDTYALFVKPLRGRGSVDGDGPGLKLLRYHPPEDRTQPWTYDVVCDFLHLSHNFHMVNWDDDPEEELIVAAKEGIWHFDLADEDVTPAWKATQLTDSFAGEVRDGVLPGGSRFIAAIEPMHGSKAAVYINRSGDWKLSKVLDEQLKDGHAIVCDDFLGVGSDQIVVGWRAMNEPGIPGIKMFTPRDETGSKWSETTISAGDLAVEDIKSADLDGDGRIDLIVGTRQTKNLVVLFNEPTSE